MASSISTRRLSHECLEFATLIGANEKTFANNELVNGQCEDATFLQIKQVVRFIKFYSTSRRNVQANVINETPAKSIDATSSRSLFEVLLSIYQHLHVGRIPLVVQIDTNRDYFKSLFSAIGSLSFEEAHPTGRSAYGIQIVFDSADVAAAFAELANADADRTAPWRIRQCWIQESLLGQFESEFYADGVVDEAVLAMLQPFGHAMLFSRRLSLPLVVGVTEAHIDSDGVVLVNFFRTAKDCVDLLAKKRITVGSGVTADELCASVWTENISLALEMVAVLPALNVWINSVGLLDPSVPFTFGLCRSVYGTDLALIQAAAAIGNDDAADPNAALAEYLDDLTENYTSFQTVAASEGSGHLNVQTTTVLRKPEQLWRVSGALTVQSPCVRKLLANLIFNQQKTIVTPFGTIFAN